MAVRKLAKGFDFANIIILSKNTFNSNFTTSSLSGSCLALKNFSFASAPVTPELFGPNRTKTFIQVCFKALPRFLRTDLEIKATLSRPLRMFRRSNLVRWPCPFLCKLYSSAHRLVLLSSNSKLTSRLSKAFVIVNITPTIPLLPPTQSKPAQLCQQLAGTGLHNARSALIYTQAYVCLYICTLIPLFFYRKKSFSPKLFLGVDFDTTC